ncbi:EthD domain-containing protein [Exophiala viscosa]|uniref:EthD domain-containing protein n=1 Tax=Exophiala viscosa TaxID=2486360 RepID=A0AAN6IIE8_9EURO|nr:EthD domain-containing protein [Exophiala viscosa]
MSTQDDKTSSGPVTILALVTRKQSLTTQEFHKYWIDKHGPLVGPFLSKMGALTYRQFHVDPATTSVPYDGIVQLELPSMETWAKLSSDPFYKEVVMPDETKFFETDKVVLVTGRNYSVVENGQFVLESK